jgi:hypothetical protein
MNNISTKVDAVTLTPKEGTDLIVGSYLNGTYKRTFLFKGSPGIGKSSLARDAAAELAKTYPGFQYVEINPTMPADEVGGIPDLVRQEGQATRTDYALPAWFPTAEANPDWRGIINLDDALQGDRMMQQTLANLILARNLRGHKLPEGAMIVATGNRVEDKAGVTRTLTHFADRMCHINVEAEPQAWLEDFAIPRGLSEKVIGYIMLDKSNLDKFDPDAEKCPTPRTWEAVSGWVKYLDTLNKPGMERIRNKYAQSVLAGELGIGEATKFWAFCSLFGRLPNIDDLLKDPENASINYEIDVQYALIVAIANRMDDKNFGAAIKYIDRIGPDFVTLAVKLGTKHRPEIRKCKEYTQWVIQNQGVVHSI